MTLKLKIPANTVAEDFQAQMLSGKDQDQALVISIKQSRKPPAVKFQMPVKGRRFTNKRKGLHL